VDRRVEREQAERAFADTAAQEGVSNSSSVPPSPAMLAQDSPAEPLPPLAHTQEESDTAAPEEEGSSSSSSSQTDGKASSSSSGSSLGAFSVSTLRSIARYLTLRRKTNKSADASDPQEGEDGESESESEKKKAETDDDDEEVAGREGDDTDGEASHAGKAGKEEEEGGATDDTDAKTAHHHQERLYVPGAIVHVFHVESRLLARMIPRDHPTLTSLHISASVLDEHRGSAYHRALKSLRLARKLQTLGVLGESAPMLDGDGGSGDALQARQFPAFTSFSAVTACEMCGHPFTWHETSDSVAQAALSKHNCRSCGRACCGPCSTHRVALHDLGLAQPVRVCDQCLYSSSSC
jgi:hypothetical protein